jgi:hypothetical protein
MTWQKSRRRSRDGAFTRLSHRLLTSEQWKTLPPVARSIYVHACSLFDGKNNGEIGLGAVAAGRVANVSPATAYRAINDLLTDELLKVRKEAVSPKFATRADGKRVRIGDGTTREYEIPLYTRRDWGNDWLRLDHWMIKSAAYRKLDSNERCTLLEMMRRYDGNNNGDIAFGGGDGAWIGLSADITERALKGLEKRGFIICTQAANPRLERRRRWELTMYKVGRNGPKKLFMSADESARSISKMRVTDSPLTTTPTPASGGNGNLVNDIALGVPNNDTRADEKDSAASVRTGESHVEAIYSAKDAERVKTSPAAPRQPGLWTQRNLFEDDVLPVAETASKRLVA